MVKNSDVIFRSTDNGSILAINKRTGIVFGKAGEKLRKEREKRIADWTSKEVLERASGKTGACIFNEFDNTPEPIAVLPKKYLSYFRGAVDDPRIFCSQAYFVNHIINHHEHDFPLEEYKSIQDIIYNCDYVIPDKRPMEHSGTKSNRDGLIFVKKCKEKNKMLVVSLDMEGNHIIFHKSMSFAPKNPYPKLHRIRILSEDARPSIGLHLGKVSGIRLYALDEETIRKLIWTGKDNSPRYTWETHVHYSGPFAGLNRIRH